eukprot:SAG22_NODE_1647_length_3899_cov_39.380789_5_plen_160_part_00
MPRQAEQSCHLRGGRPAATLPRNPRTERYICRQLVSIKLPRLWIGLDGREQALVRRQTERLSHHSVHVGSDDGARCRPRPKELVVPSSAAFASSSNGKYCGRGLPCTSHPLGELDRLRWQSHGAVQTLLKVLCESLPLLIRNVTLCLRLLVPASSAIAE